MKPEGRPKKNKEDNRIVFATKYNPRGPDVKAIVEKNIHLITGNPELKKLYPDGSILVASKRESNLKELIMRGDPYSIKSDLCDTENHGYKKCTRKCDSCSNFVDETSYITSNATGRKFKIKRDTTCTTPNVIYVAYCTNCQLQGVGSTVSWKPRLSNYKSHIKKKISSCCIVKHFLDCCKDLKYLRFIILDKLNNIDNLSQSEIDALLLSKEKFWIGTLITQHKGMNGTHDWNRSKRFDKDKGR